MDRLAARKAVAHRRQHVRVGPDLRMACHASVGRWQAGIAGGGHGRVAEPAVDPESADVVLVAEGHRLLDVPVLLAAVVRARIGPPPADASEDRDAETD